jgi:hypothetical protein
MLNAENAVYVKKSVANLQKNAPKGSEFSGAGTVLALSLSLS